MYVIITYLVRQCNTLRASFMCSKESNHWNNGVPHQTGPVDMIDLVPENKDKEKMTVWDHTKQCTVPTISMKMQ